MMLYRAKKGHFFNVLYCLDQLLTFGIAGLKAAGSFNWSSRKGLLLEFLFIPVLGTQDIKE